MPTLTPLSFPLACRFIHRLSNDWYSPSVPYAWGFDSFNQTLWRSVKPSLHARLTLVAGIVDEVGAAFLRASSGGKGSLFGCGYNAGDLDHPSPGMSDANLREFITHPVLVLCKDRGAVDWVEDGWLVGFDAKHLHLACYDYDGVLHEVTKVPRSKVHGVGAVQLRATATQESSGA